MTTSQDQPPLSRRELRERARARAEEFDDSAEADRVSSGRRARAADGDGLVEVGNTGAIGTVTSDPSGDDARAATDATDPADASSSESTETDDSSTVVTESAIAKPFPFADQVEATSDDEGHTAFRLNDFTPEPAAAPAEEPSFDALFSDLLEPDADAENDTASEKTGDTGQPDDTTGDDAGVSDSAVSDSASSDVPVGEPIDVHEPVAPVTPVELPQEERTLSRREWRAMRAAAAAEAAASESPDTETSDTATSVTETSDTATSDSETSDSATSASESSDSDEPKAPEAHEPQASDVEIVFQEPATDERDADQTGADQTDAGQTGADQTDEREAERPAPQTTPSGSVFIPPLVEPTAAPHSALSDAMAEFEALTRATENEAAAKAPSDDDAPVDIERPAPAVAAPAAAAAAAPVAGEQSKPAVESTPFSFLVNPPASAQPAPSAAAADDADAYTPPIGHWSRQAELDDENQPFENTLSRDVGGGNVATTTNALVLPMIPQRDDFSSVLNATGEIMVTGTINLPGSVGTTGRDSRHYDDPEVDHLFDAFDNEIPNTDSAPVRAITAVSSHTATRGGIEPGRKQSNRMLNVLLVTASVMAVAVVGLLVAGFVFNIF